MEIMRNDHFVIVAATLHDIHHKLYQPVRGYLSELLDELVHEKSLLLLHNVDIDAQMASSGYHPDPAQPPVENGVIELR
jgi:hypothetical protein